MLELFLKWLIPFVCGGAMTAIIGYFTIFRAFRDGLQCLLRAEIIRSHDKYMERGHCPYYAKEALRREYAAYHKLGGNDVATRCYDETMNLPTE